MKREERTDDITCIVAFIEAPPDAPRKTPKFEAPAPEGGGGSGPPQRRKSRRGSHSMDSFFGQVEFLHPNAQRDAARGGDVVARAPRERNARERHARESAAPRVTGARVYAQARRRHL